MRLELSPVAFAELQNILRYVADRNPDAASRIAGRFDEAFAHIARYPEGAQEVEQRAGVRRLPLVRYPYVIFYEQTGEQIVVLRILYGTQARPWDK